MMLFGATMVFSCGPGVQAIHEGDVRFEHCYRLDLDPNIVRSHREACWRDWVRSYTSGQNRDRTDYARQRVQELSQPNSRPGLELDVAGHAGEPWRQDVASPTNVHKPPPPTSADQFLQKPADPVSVQRRALPPGHECSSACERDWQDCTSTKKSAGGTGNDPVDPCDGEYRECVERCLSDAD